MESTIERLKGESENAYKTFLAYAAMPASLRSYKAVIAQSAHTEKTIYNWSCTHNWKERIKQEDQLAAKRAVQELLSKDKRMVLDTIEDSLHDATLFRQEIMKALDDVDDEQGLATLQIARRENDDWVTDLYHLMLKAEGLKNGIQEEDN